MIPLRTLENLSADQIMEPGEVLKVGFEWGGLTKERKIARMKQRAEFDEKSEYQTLDADREVVELYLEKSRKRDRLKYLFWVNVKLAKI